MSIRKYTNKLRTFGFERTSRCRDCTIFSCTRGTRTVHVQFWTRPIPQTRAWQRLSKKLGYGPGHRVSHGDKVKGIYREVSLPANFDTVDQMINAVGDEWGRKD
jgi:hypothetical protein